MLIWLITRACRRWLPANLFVFLLGAGFLGLFDERHYLRRR